MIAYFKTKFSGNRSNIIEFIKNSLVSNKNDVEFLFDVNNYETFLFSCDYKDNEKVIKFGAKDVNSTDTILKVKNIQITMQ